MATAEDELNPRRGLPPACPICGGPFDRLDYAITERAEDKRRLCRLIVWCENGHGLWRWADQEPPWQPYPN